MAMSIRTNVSSLDAQRNLYNTQNLLDSSLSRLSSGYRITTAGDDAAGLGISVNLQAQIRSFAQAARNAQDGISLVQTAEGSLNEITNILTRLRELAMESASSGVEDAQREYIQTEVNQLTAEIDRIANAAEYNGTKLLAKDGGKVIDLTFQVGINHAGDGDNANTIAMKTADATAETGLGLLKEKTIQDEEGNDVTIKVLDLSTQTEAQKALDTIDKALATVSKTRATFGAVGNRLNNAISNIQSAAQNLSAANSRIRDVDIAEETSQMTRAQILMQAGVSVLAQANQIPQAALKLLG
jgi:flagellin